MPAKASPYTRTRNRYSPRVTAGPVCSTTDGVESMNEGMDGCNQLRGPNSPIRQYNPGDKDSRREVDRTEMRHPIVGERIRRPMHR